MPDAAKPMDAIMALCKRRGFIYQASEIYGGINGFWDYGPLGAQLKKNLRDAWWQDMIMNPCWGRSGPNGRAVECVPVETSIIQHRKVWEASGHVGGFNDLMVDCKACKSRYREDHLICFQIDEIEPPPDWVAGAMDFRPVQKSVAILTNAGLPLEECREQLAKLLGAKKVKIRQIVMQHPGETPSPGSIVEANGKSYWVDRIVSSGEREGHHTAICPRCGGELTEPRRFNLMFHSYTGATATEDDKVYLRPETAQGIFIQFKNVVDTTRIRVPFGIGNTGRSFRNEVTPRNFTFRSREFEQAELEFFCHPDDSHAWYEFWRDFRMEWWQSIGLAGENLILREHEKDELSHYSSGTSDVEYRFPFTAPGFGELEGIAHRGCFDLTQHQKHSGQKLDYFDTERGEIGPNGQPKGERYIPHCIEPAAGLDRGALALICEGYTRDESRPSPELLKLHPRIAPIKAAVFPLVKKDGMPEIADKLYVELRKRFGHLGFIETDPKQSIGKRYARMDEAGCPYCFTIDSETLTHQTVTVRDRDTGSQERIGLGQAPTYLAERLG